MRAWLLAAALAATASAAPFSPSELNGRRIYLDGVSASGHEIKGLVGMARAPMPGPIVACANCHGADGLGRPEAGIVPSPVTWSELAKAYGHVHEDGRRHPAFDEAGLGSAIVAGVDPAGRPYDLAMPRYRMHADDLRDLVAYMRRLEDDRDPGISARAIRVGTVLPDTGAVAGMAEGLRAAIEAVFAEVNAAGGVYGRRLELVARGHAAHPEATVPAARALLDSDEVFALLAPFAFGAEEALAALAEERKVPLVGPFTVRGPAAPAGRYTFYLFSGLIEQAEVLVAFGLEHAALDRSPLAIVYPEGAAAAADAADGRCAHKGCAATVRLIYREGAFDAASLAKQAREAGTGSVLFLGPAAELERFADAAARAAWFPNLLSPGMLAARAAGRLGPRFAGRLFLAYPTAPARRDAEGDDAFARFAARHRIAPSLPGFQGYLAASLLADALRRSGRAVGRERLVASLEATTDYQTTLGHPLRYGPQRRIGALGGHVVVPAGDEGFRQASGWIGLE